MGQSRGRATPARLTLFGELELEASETAGAAPALLHHGAQMADQEFAPEDAAWEEFHEGCRGLAAKYAGIPDDANLQYRTGVVSLPGNADVWAHGDHGVRCYLWLDGAELTGSLKGKGTKALPVQYK